MKILITGSEGFIGRNLVKSLSGYNIRPISHKEVDLTNREQVNSIFKEEFFDFVIHCAGKGGSRLREDDSSVFVDNLLMFNNILSNKHNFNKLITIGSGAELDRTHDISESTNILNRFPQDFYGMSKNIIGRICLIEKKCINIRVFSLFGLDEPNTRFVKTCINNCLSNKPINIEKNKKNDFFYIKDLVTVIKYCIDSKESNISQLDCCYDEVFTLHELANLINKLVGTNVEIIVKDTEIGKSYTGKYEISDNISLIGLRDGISEMINEIKNQKGSY